MGKVQLHAFMYSLSQFNSRAHQTKKKQPNPGKSPTQLTSQNKNYSKIDPLISNFLSKYTMPLIIRL